MIPYHEISRDERDTGIFICRFDDLGSFLVREHYCVRPSCDCRQVVLEFRPDGDKPQKKPFAAMLLSLDTWQWEPAGEYRVKKGSPAENMLSRFQNELTEELKQIFLRHYREAKEYGIKHPLSYMDPEVLETGLNVGYAEVFGDEDVELFRLNIDGQDYFFDDQYCIDPQCDCREAVITVTRINGKRTEDCGAISVSFSGQCKVMDGSGGLKPMQEWLKQKDRLALLKKRCEPPPPTHTLRGGSFREHIFKAARLKLV
ncbi:MAG: hypothetical protein ACOY4Q_07560 [Bacillota bacterium]